MFLTWLIDCVCTCSYVRVCSLRRKSRSWQNASSGDESTDATTTTCDWCLLIYRATTWFTICSVDIVEYHTALTWEKVTVTIGQQCLRMWIVLKTTSTDIINTHGTVNDMVARSIWTAFICSSCVPSIVWSLSKASCCQNVFKVHVVVVTCMYMFTRTYVFVSHILCTCVMRTFCLILSCT